MALIVPKNLLSIGVSVYAICGDDRRPDAPVMGIPVSPSSCWALDSGRSTRTLMPSGRWAVDDFSGERTYPDSQFYGDAKPEHIAFESQGRWIIAYTAEYAAGDYDRTRYAPTIYDTAVNSTVAVPERKDCFGYMDYYAAGVSTDAAARGSCMVLDVPMEVLTHG